ncbi:hypothetical protein HanIR_Chr03g0115381 [Helianthus annuus]|nr:hypothetical protein HanIR_Chr03g0115381 [Helianthus annuus]
MLLELSVLANINELSPFEAFPCRSFSLSSKAFNLPMASSNGMFPRCPSIAPSKLPSVCSDPSRCLGTYEQLPHPSKWLPRSIFPYHRRQFTRIFIYGLPVLHPE